MLSFASDKTQCTQEFTVAMVTLLKPTYSVKIPKWTVPPLVEKLLVVKGK